ncbi:MAG: hypothetical protein IKF68_08295 [Erysipelotrichaceae bacterium]|nr:hypothetical protein [Erysipelotrichaceae bacterium]
MGEKIRDLKKIHIGKAEFMVELNEGYTKEQGNVMHIQNERFRYLFKEQDFLHLCAEILRAESELDYLKEHSFKTDNVVPQGNSLRKDGLSDSLVSFLKLLADRGINFRVIEEGDSFSTVIVDPEDRNSFRSLVKSDQDIKILSHPFGEMFGYRFLYKMDPFELYRYDGRYIEAFYQLPCMSTTEKTWIPLDRSIQKKIWTAGESERLDPICYYIYRLCWAVFKDKGFSDATVEVLDENLPLTEDDELRKYLQPVFFNFTDELLMLLKEKHYSEIIERYYTYINY